MKTIYQGRVNQRRAKARPLANTPSDFEGPLTFASKSERDPDVDLFRGNLELTTQVCFQETDFHRR